MAAAVMTQPLDSLRAGAFAERLLGLFGGGAVSLMISIGHRAGLFDAMADAGRVTSAELAARAGLDERYVREWLGAMAAGGIVETGPDARFELPREHAAHLTRAAAQDNLAVFAQYIGVLGAVEDDVLRCFRAGGGVPYERFARFHEVMAEDSGQSVLPALESHVLGLVPEIRTRLDRGARVLDAGCGRGKALLQLAQSFPNSRFVGVDLSDEAVAFARQAANAAGITNVEYVAADLSSFDRDAASAQYDLIFTFDAVHDQAEPARLLKGIWRALKDDGVYVMQDIHAHSHVHENLDNPLAPLLYTVSCMHCMTVSLAQGGQGLGAMWGRELAERMLREAGFASIAVHRFDHDIQNDWYVIQK